MPHFASEWAHLGTSQPACQIFPAHRKILHALVLELPGTFVLSFIYIYSHASTLHAIPRYKALQSDHLQSQPSQPSHQHTTPMARQL